MATKAWLLLLNIGALERAVLAQSSLAPLEAPSDPPCGLRFSVPPFFLLPPFFFTDVRSAAQLEGFLLAPLPLPLFLPRVKLIRGTYCTLRSASSFAAWKGEGSHGGQCSGWCKGLRGLESGVWRWGWRPCREQWNCLVGVKFCNTLWRDNEKPRAVSTQLKSRCEGHKSSLVVYKQALIFCSGRAGESEGKTQD